MMESEHGQPVGRPLVTTLMPMLLRTLALLIAGFAPLLAPAQSLDPPFASGSIVLLQPDRQLSERIGGDAGSLASYIHTLRTAFASQVEAHPPGRGTTGVLVVAVRPGGKSRVWLEFGPNERPDSLADSVKAHLESVQPPMVSGGPVSFLVNFELWGGGTPVTRPDRPMRAPAEWMQEVERAGRPLDTDAILDAVWPDED